MVSTAGIVRVGIYIALSSRNRNCADAGPLQEVATIASFFNRFISCREP
jgi:hypothetical protein